jgi:hypothetical protein
VVIGAGKRVQTSIEQESSSPMTETHATVSPTVPAPSSGTFVHWIWPAAIIIFGLALNIAWVVLLGYGLTRVIALAF